jgi:hypothetical protein
VTSSCSIAPTSSSSANLVPLDAPAQQPQQQGEGKKKKKKKSKSATHDKSRVMVTKIRRTAWESKFIIKVKIANPPDLGAQLFLQAERDDLLKLSWTRSTKPFINFNGEGEVEVKAVLDPAVQEGQEVRGRIYANMGRVKPTNPNDNLTRRIVAPISIRLIENTRKAEESEDDHDYTSVHIGHANGNWLLWQESKAMSERRKEREMKRAARLMATLNRDKAITDWYGAWHRNQGTWGYVNNATAEGLDHIWPEFEKTTAVWQLQEHSAKSIILGAADQLVQMLRPSKTEATCKLWQQPNTLKGACQLFNRVVTPEEGIYEPCILAAARTIQNKYRITWLNTSVVAVLVAQQWTGKANALFWTGPPPAADILLLMQVHGNARFEMRRPSVRQFRGDLCEGQCLVVPKDAIFTIAAAVEGVSMTVLVGWIQNEEAQNYLCAPTDERKSGAAETDEKH